MRKLTEVAGNIAGIAGLLMCLFWGAPESWDSLICWAMRP